MHQWIISQQTLQAYRPRQVYRPRQAYRPRRLQTRRPTDPGDGDEGQGKHAPGPFDFCSWRHASFNGGHLCQASFLYHYLGARHEWQDGFSCPL
ncbi:hypothetical protein NHX12_003113 [Muraenolepis orangiensis]|uniref:Uncharacterized protein n=1 Tax=Muraenolepis orangiensis TaxID=630683 RepID=A0A9Q0IFC8_9TELE|nr:hypothetical protein NHX12_003113 [Muraenolepis orangiensis]